ncbi:hypothetical protein Y032_0079g1280 [Ancylostoma ceylanicum]|uniref:Uncharacterized protein n=1 Tax=Ancylostoma ceylanicum TaxID=53326 RepID=A0A016TU88_9BILA|nr:hypothetical protein Y032_0079g1280 [Ancylostoma ceylanicum]
MLHTTLNKMCGQTHSVEGREEGTFMNTSTGMALHIRARIHERKTQRNQVSKSTSASCASQRYAVHGITNHQSR